MGSLFDEVEDFDASKCLKRLIEINKLNQKDEPEPPKKTPEKKKKTKEEPKKESSGSSTPSAAKVAAAVAAVLFLLSNISKNKEEPTPSKHRR